MEKADRIYNILLMILFLGVLSLPLILSEMRFYVAPDISESENRKLAEKPVFNITLLDPFPAAYDAWYKDHFVSRPFLMRFHSYLFAYSLFNLSPVPDKVVRGKSGWLFDTKELPVGTGEFMLPDEEISRFVGILHARTRFCDSLGILLYVVIPTMKGEVYREYLPARYRKVSDSTFTDKIITAIKADTVIRFIDVRSHLIAMKDSLRLYYYTDTHWNYEGSFAAYQEVVGRIKKDFPAIRTISRNDFEFFIRQRRGGNLSRMIGLRDFIQEDFEGVRINNMSARPQTKKGYPPPSWISFPNEYELVFGTRDTTLPDLLVIRDSFIHNMMPFLNEGFHEVVYIFDGWLYAANKEIILSEKPDIVLLEMYEPHIRNMLKNRE